MNGWRVTAAFIGWTILLAMAWLLMISYIDALFQAGKQNLATCLVDAQAEHLNPRNVCS